MGAKEHAPFEALITASVGGLFHFRHTDIYTRAQSSRLAEFGGLGMSFNICRGTLGSLAMFTAIGHAYYRQAMIRCSPDETLSNMGFPYASGGGRLAEARFCVKS
jgi:hypothetical protein